MNPLHPFKHQFVEYIPEQIEEGTIYISIIYKTIVHKCACGCGNEVITPLSPTDWQVIYNGDSISLSPSIGNWGLNCQSHYWITQNKITRAKSWSKQKVRKNHQNDKKNKQHHYQNILDHSSLPQISKKSSSNHQYYSIWSRMTKYVKRFYSTNQKPKQHKTNKKKP